MKQLQLAMAQLPVVIRVTYDNKSLEMAQANELAESAVELARGLMTVPRVRLGRL